MSAYDWLNANVTPYAGTQSFAQPRYAVQNGAGGGEGGDTSAVQAPSMFNIAGTGAAPWEWNTGKQVYARSNGQTSADANVNSTFDTLSMQGDKGSYENLNNHGGWDETLADVLPPIVKIGIALMAGGAAGLYGAGAGAAGAGAGAGEAAGIAGAGEAAGGAGSFVGDSYMANGMGSALATDGAAAGAGGFSALPAGGMTATGEYGAGNALGSGFYGSGQADIGALMGADGGANSLAGMGLQGGFAPTFAAPQWGVDPNAVNQGLGAAGTATAATSGDWISKIAKSLTGGAPAGGAAGTGTPGAASGLSGSTGSAGGTVVNNGAPVNLMPTFSTDAQAQPGYGAELGNSANLLKLAQALRGNGNG